MRPSPVAIVLLTFVNSTRLSPSAVIPACEKFMIWPNLLQLRKPAPPQRSRQVVPTRSLRKLRRETKRRQRKGVSIAIGAEYPRM